MFIVKCDGAGCNVFFSLASLDEDDYRDDLDYHDWQEDGGKHYCPDCCVEWEQEQETQQRGTEEEARKINATALNYIY